MAGSAFAALRPHLGELASAVSSMRGAESKRIWRVI